MRHIGKDKNKQTVFSQSTAVDYFRLFGRLVFKYKMEKQQEASAPPNIGDAPPPYPGTGVGGFAPPPAGKHYVYFITLRMSD